MQDGMRQAEQVAVKLECGHPNVDPGQFCPHCRTVTSAANLKVSYAYEANTNLETGEKLVCGHPNVEIEQKCPLCGKVRDFSKRSEDGEKETKNNG